MADEYVQVHPTMLSHRKIRKLARELDVPLVVARGHLVTLWMNCLSHAQDGNPVDLDNDDIAHCAEWDDEPDKFVNALIRQGWLDVIADENGVQKLEIHDWADYTGRFRLAERRRYERERKASQRAKKRVAALLPGPTPNELLSQAVPGTIPTGGGTVAKCPTLTEQNGTEHVAVAQDGNQKLLTVADLEAFLMARIGCPSLPPKWTSLAGQLIPIARGDVDEACRAARRRTPDSRSVNAGLVMRILEAKQFKANTDTLMTPNLRPSTGALSPLKGLELFKAKARWQALFDVPDIAWSVHDDQARHLERLGLDTKAVLEVARETIDAVGDSWEEFFWRAERVKA